MILKTEVPEFLKKSISSSQISYYFYFTHRLDCLEKIHQHNADFSFAEPEDMYVASIIDNKGFTILKEIRDKDDPEGKRIINVAAKFSLD